MGKKTLVILLFLALIIPGCGKKVDKKEISKCIQDFSSSIHADRWRATAIISKYKKDAVPALKKALTDPNADVRWCAAVALSMIAPDGADALPKLRNMMSNDDDASVRQVAQLAAHRIGGEDVAPQPETVGLMTSVKPGQISISVKPVDLFNRFQVYLEESNKKDTEPTNSPDKK